MSRNRDLIQREIASREPLMVGTIVGGRRLTRFDGTGPGAGIMFVCDVEVGSNRPLLNVPIKSAGDGSRFYALDGQVVLLRRNLLGRWQVVGPGDRANSRKTTKNFNLVTQAQVGGDELLGTARVVDPFEHYAGETSMKGAPLLTFLIAGNDTITRDSGSWIDDNFVGNEVLRIGRGSANVGTYTVITIGATELIMAGTAFVANETDIAKVTVGQVATSRWNDGALTFPSIRVVDGTGNTVTPS
jgi:hypothetical protein